MPTCPFCELDPYEYVDVGVGAVPVAVNCCHFGPALFDDRSPDGHWRKTMNAILEHVSGIKERNERMAKADDLLFGVLEYDSWEAHEIA
jgi:hypothetical protein